MVKMSKAKIVKEFIINEIKTGRIKNGQRLPSCRKIALQLSVNKLTVNKVYSELERDHKVFSISRGGFYLIDSLEVPQEVQEVIDFRTVRPDNKLIPYREFTHVINKAVELHKSSLFDYESTVGLLSLRNILKLTFEKDGVYATADNIIVTHGAQQAISLVFQWLIKNNKGKLLVEIPTYSLALRLAKYFNIDVVGIERKINGYDFKKMEKLFKQGEVRAFYVIPRHHNPTGYTLSEKDKQKIVELSAKYEIIIIEDDYLADLGSRKGSLPIHYYDISNRTVYIRSFSKTFMPGIRLGAAILPEFMVEAVSKLKHLSDLNTSRLPQAALEIFIQSGMYEKQIKKVKKSYEAKLRKAAEIINSLSPKDLSWYVPEYGMFIWLKLPEYISADLLEKKLENQSILIKQGSEFFLENPSGKESIQNNCNYIRLCIAGVSEESIGAIVNVISAIKSFKAFP